MEKLIIENRTELPILEVMGYVLGVISKGKISKTSKGEQYCFISSFNDGFIIYADKNKNSDRLIIKKEDNMKVKELILWNNGNTMAFDYNNEQVLECEGCILDPKVIENINLLCDEDTYFHCEVWKERYNTGIDLGLGKWFKGKKDRPIYFRVDPSSQL